MSREEDLVRSTTQAIAGTVRDVPPLRLEQATETVRVPSPAVEPDRSRRWRGSQRPASQRPGSPRRAGGNRRWRSWAAPVAAAVAVVALAVALVTIKGITNGGTANHSRTTMTGPGGVPRYYVAIRRVSTKPYAPNELVVGDTLTGKTLATFPAPADTVFASVTAAADDRTFVVTDVANPDPKDRGLGQADSWFEVRLAPGTTTPVRLTYSPLEPVYDVIATALSASGRELAVATVDSVGRQRIAGINVYSLASGHYLHGWSATDSSDSIFTSRADGGSTQWPALTWIDGDRAIAFTTQGQAPGTSATSGYAASVRVIKVAGPRAGDLMADSTAVWSPRQPSTGNQQLPCQYQLPMISADGTTVICVTATAAPPSTATGHVTWMLSWVTYGKTRTAAHGAVAYRVSVGARGSSSLARCYALWANPTGSTIIGEWSVSSLPTPVPGRGPSGSSSIALVDPGSAMGPGHVGVISHGKFTPLRLAAGSTAVAPQQIAW